jgi:mycofactocin precursor peptide peptidase
LPVWFRRHPREPGPVTATLQLADLAWTDLAQRSTSRTSEPNILAVPLGSTEQHGPHLPLSTDADIAVAMCRRLAASRPDVLVAPVLAYGSSGEHEGFPGTLSIGQEALELVALELGRSASATFPRLLYVSAHGGNARPLGRAVARLRAESRDVLLFMPSGYADAHAGHDETSMLLELSPSRVRMAAAVRGDTRPLRELWPSLRDGGVLAVAESGVLGDPTGATAEQGRAILDDLATQLAEAVEQWLAERP